MPEGKQKALFLESKFGLYIIGERPIPKPGAGQLLVRNEAVALNPVDWKIQKYGVFVEDFPAVVGTDIAGVVEEVGEGVTGFSKGDRVFFQGDWSNDLAGYQQYTLAFAETTAKIPPGVSFESAATIPVALAAAVVGLYNTKPHHGAGYTPPFEPSARGKYAGKPIVIIGGASSVGQYVIQFAKLSGFSPIIAISSSKHEEFLKSLGATHIVDRHIPQESIPAEIAKITTAPIDIVFDAISLDDTQQVSYDLLADGGHLVLVLPSQIRETEGKTFSSILGVWTLDHTRELGLKLYSQLGELLGEGVIKPNRVEVLPGGLNGIVGGLNKLENHQVSGVKLVVHPQETTA
ncbi:Dehydrogenase azaJ [Hypsizygus marmoreus]|uniref:Dehydrogenase azaJ n=1 Tax=Hypsizygus marmoreus TaxID=39966 RepID=A0A369K289_HYPMA|nr:Dehydrogenase azaJ [Hypsizygus marmoreus]